MLTCKPCGIRNAILAGILVVALTGCGLSPVPLEAPAAEQEETQTTEPQGTVSTEKDSGSTDVEESETYEDMAVDGVALNGMATEVGYAPVYQEFNTEEYGSVEETGFVATATTPLSTVSADADTASYANLRRMLEDGYKTQAAAAAEKDDDGEGPASDVVQDADQPDDTEDLLAEPDFYYEDPYFAYGGYEVIPTGAVRIEEMLNYFDYDYPLPEGEESFAITARAGACPWNEDTELLQLGFSTPDEDRAVREAGANLVFLIDVSGSMEDPDKLPLLKSSFGELVETLGERDVISVVTYSGEEEVVLDSVSGSDHRAIMRAIRGLEAEGSTNGEAGLRMAYELAEDNYIEGGVNRIVMASDGDLNVGMTSESDLHDFVDKRRESGIYLSVLGFGAGNYKDTKMETLADHGNGSYHYIDCEAEAKRVFGERLCANLVPFANDVKLQVEFNPAQVKAYRLIGYENRALAAEDFADDKKDAGEVGPQSQFTVLYEIVRPDSPLQIDVPELKYGTHGAEAASDEWFTAKLRYKGMGSEEPREQELAADASVWSEDPGADWRFAAAVTEFGMLLRQSEYAGTSSYDAVRALVGETEDPLRAGFLELVAKAETN